MPSLRSDLVRRIERLPKPARTGDALLPLFEAISNAIHSVQDRYKTQVTKRGHIDVRITKAKGRKPLKIIVSDNGVGLDRDNFDAFSTTDTDHKIQIGGKGVGRLLWLDCFASIHVDSVYTSGEHTRRRSFNFTLKNDEQITDYVDVRVADQTDTGVTITFTGLRDNGYDDKFPSRLGHIFRHVTSHFLRHCQTNQILVRLYILKLRVSRPSLPLGRTQRT